MSSNNVPLQQSAKRSITELVNLHLFGRPPTVIANKPKPIEKAPETRLKLTLRGISAGTGDNAGGALIEGSDRKTDFYRVGMKLSGNITLHAVYADHIILDRRGKLESLSFPKK